MLARSLFAALVALAIVHAAPTRHGKRQSHRVAERQEAPPSGYWTTYETSAWIPAANAAPATVTVTATVTVQNQPEATSTTNPPPILGVDLGVSVSLGLGGSASTTTTSATPTNSASPPPGGKRKHVFAHFMVGIVSTYAAEDWEADIRLAQEKGITGFAANIGVDPYTEAQLDLGYAAAQKNGFDMFISFDFNWYRTSDVAGVTTMLARYANHPAQLKVDGKPFVSTFIGDGFDWEAVARGIGQEIYSVPFWMPSQENANNAGIEGLFSWAAWPGQLDNQPVLQNMTTERDELYIQYTKNAGKTYMAPVSPWFFTHFGKEVPYSKNWLFYSEQLWKTRWDQILRLGQHLEFLEIVTWNDYGESHYIGPTATKHTDDGSNRWTMDFDHVPMLDMAQPYISAFKQGLSEPVIEQEMLVYWHRPHLKSAQCDETDNCGSKPTGWEMVEDAVFVTTMTKSGGTVTVQSGGNAPFTQTVQAGVQTFQVPMGLGEQRFDFTSSSGGSAQGTSAIPITDQCWNGIYNFNFHSGALKL